MHAHTCTTVPTFANHESQSAFELRPPPVRNEICQSRKQTGTGIPLPVAGCWRGQVLENPELPTPKFVCSKCAERAHDLCFFTLWNQEELVEKENNEADNQEKMTSLWLQLLLKHHSNSSKAQLVPLLRMCYVSKQRHYYKNVWWKVMWDGPGLELMGNRVFAAVRGVESLPCLCSAWRWAQSPFIWYIKLYRETSGGGGRPSWCRAQFTVTYF